MAFGLSNIDLSYINDSMKSDRAITERAAMLTRYLSFGAQEDGD